MGFNETLLTGRGYLHDILSLGNASAIQIAVINGATLYGPLRASRLDCLVEDELHSHLNQYQPLMQEGQAVVLAFIAEIEEKNAEDTGEQAVRLRAIREVYVNGVKQFPALPPLSLRRVD